MEKLHKLRTLHLFTGAGGGILADMLLGHRPVCAVEIEPYCQRVLAERQRDGFLPWFPIWDDVATFDGNPWRGLVDLVAGGFPCQDISMAGRGAGIEGAKSGLWKEFARIIGQVRPRFAFVENSSALIRRGLAVVLSDLALLGYDAVWTVLGADNVGAPHRRKRIWILAYSQKIRHPWRETRNFFEKEKRQDWNMRILPCRAGERTSYLANADQTRLEEWPSESADHEQKLQAAQRGRCEWWDQDPADEPGATQSGLGRVANGVANRSHRIKALGNGQVPLCAAIAFQKLLGETKWN